ncbi:hypothetical protein D9M70_337650 [compost metagenome]
MEGALGGHVQHQVPVGLVHLQDGAILDQAGVVDQHVDAAEGFLACANHVSHLVFHTHIALHGDCLAAVALDATGGFTRGIEIQVRDDHGHAFLCQHAGGFRANAAGRARDDRHAAIQSKIHFSSFVGIAQVQWSANSASRTSRRAAR